jgi:hypothetical protein
VPGGPATRTHKVVIRVAALPEQEITHYGVFFLLTGCEDRVDARQGATSLRRETESPAAAGPSATRAMARLLRVLLGSVELGTSVRPLIISLRVGFCSANAASRSCALPFGLAPKVPVCASQVQGSAVFHEASVLAVNGGRTVLHNAHSGALWPSERQPAEAALNDGYRSKCGTISQTPLIQNSSA